VVRVQIKYTSYRSCPPRWEQIHYKGHWKGRVLKIKTFLGPEMTTNKTQEHKITNVGTCFFYLVLGLADFDGGKSITLATGMGGPL
jgi:hypothetical protein